MELINRALPRVLDFDDYRSYLQLWLIAKRQRSPHFSVRQFCRMSAKISTENYLLRVLRRERNLGPRNAEKFIKALALDEIEADYFRTLVNLEKARTESQRQEFLKKLVDLREQKPGATLIYQESWQISAAHLPRLREMVIGWISKLRAQPASDKLAVPSDNIEIQLEFRAALPAKS